MSRRRVVVAAAIVTVTVFAGGCGEGSGDREAYTFDPPHGPVDVDTPELRKAKSAAGIQKCPASSAAASTADPALPDVVLPCLGGGLDVQLAGLADKADQPLVVNFWAQYCGPCRKEAPLFEEVHQALGDQVSVIGVDFQDPQPGQAIALADELGLTYPQLADPAGASRAALGLVGLPATVLVAESGQIAHIELREIKTSQDLADLLEEHLHINVPAGTSP